MKATPIAAANVRPTTTFKAGAATALVLLLSACSKPDQPAATDPSSVASAASTSNAADIARALANCDHIPNPSPKDDSATSRAVTVTNGLNARRECRQKVEKLTRGDNDNLHRLRELADQSDAEKKQEQISDAEWKRKVRQGASRPIHEYNYGK